MADVAVSRVSLSHIERALAELGNVQVAVAQRVESVQSQQFELDNRMQALAAMFAAYVEADRQAKELQLAETRIVKVRQELETTFGHYGDVRRRATGILQALDAGVVTHETIQSTSEEVMLSTPRYWLAPALVALAAWSRDDPPLAEKALREALERDVDKTALFLALVLRRFGRHQAVGRWLGHFFGRQDPASLRREFVVILDSVSTGAFGPDAKAITGAEVRRWLDELAVRTDFGDTQRERWQSQLVALTPVVDDGNYEHLARHTPSWTQLKASLAAVRRNGVVIHHFAAVFEGELPIPRSLEEQVDDLLDALVGRFDAEELPLRQQEAELQAVIQCNGNRDEAAKRIESTLGALEETVDFPSLLTNAAMHPEESGASRGTQRLAIALSRDWIVAAQEVLTAATRKGAPTSIALKVDSWEGAVADGARDEDVVAEFTDHMDGKTSQAVKAVKFGGAYAVATGAAVLCLAVGAAAASVVLIVAAVVAAGYAGVGWYGLDKRRQEARTAGDNAKRAGLEQLKACLGEVVDLRAEWTREDARAEVAIELLQAISPEEHSLSRAEDPRAVV